ncbi:MAG TPA: DUF6660 family protein [Flavobacterium sp.]|uniref:DUF6660 family protein n=1 Tax=Flavobacterium sp. TaxID=239 RepID=UPI0028EBE253|nr:DUF6660 family protein [uncultured Flavobacterium sp.]
MKLTNTILSIVILILSCMPCADMGINSFAHTKSELVSKQDNHSHEKENDLCSPFCICSCCGSQMASYSRPMAIDFPIPFKDIETQLPTYQSIFTSNFYGSIWQPPQLV